MATAPAVCTQVASTGEKFIRLEWPDGMYADLLVMLIQAEEFADPSSGIESVVRAVVDDPERLASIDDLTYMEIMLRLESF